MTLLELHRLQCSVEGLDFSHIKKKSRKWDAIKYRKAFIIVARLDLAYTMEEIGLYLNQDHSTIVHTIKQYKEELGDKKKEVTDIVERLRSVCANENTITVIVINGQSALRSDVKRELIYNYIKELLK